MLIVIQCIHMCYFHIIAVERSLLFLFFLSLLLLLYHFYFPVVSLVVLLDLIAIFALFCYFPCQLFVLVIIKFVKL